MRAVHKGLPLPLGAVDNRRSFVAIDNLVNLILSCLRHPAAANQTLLVSDGEDLSTTSLLRRTAQALGRSARLLPLPAPALRAVARTLGRAEMAQRLFGSLQVDIEHTRALLGWSPVVSVDEGLRQVAVSFLAGRQAEFATGASGR
jgi:UDP-glucose 4-epimerase